MRVPCCVMHRFSPSFCFRMFRKVEKLRLECSERCIIATEHFHAGSGFLAPSSTVYFPVASQTVPICHCTATKKKTLDNNFPLATTPYVQPLLMMGTLDVPIQRASDGKVS